MAKQTFTTGQVLTAAQMTSLQQTAMLGGAASAKTASYTLVAADAGGAISMSNASATTITVNTALFAAGDTVNITNLGAGVCTITAGTATVNTSASLALAQYESGTLDFTSTSAAIFIKGAGAAAASGGMTLLSTTSLSGATTTISSISQSYNSLVAIVYGIADGVRLDIGLNGAGANFSMAAAEVFGAGPTKQVSRIQGYATSIQTMYANDQNVFQLAIGNYTATQYKPTTFYGRYNDSSGYYGSLNAAGGTDITTAVTSLQFRASGGTFSTGTVLLYGVK